MRKEIQHLKQQLQSLQSGETICFSSQELDTMLSAMEQLESSRRLDQPSEALINAVEHLIEVESSTKDDDGKFSIDDLNAAWLDTKAFLAQAKRSLHFSDDKLKEIISKRLREEFQKYGKREDMDWAAIAAGKIVGITRDVLGGFISLRLIKVGDDCAIALKNFSDRYSESEQEIATHLYNQWMLKRSLIISELSMFHELRSTEQLCKAAREYMSNPSQENEEILTLSIEQVEGKKFS